ncbi:hypothetical protein [Halomontanus rarus]|uniref:hypothetical protein n=1 Tax=Halomontanus rarus TaxID=3034020 RepID=UPI0023E83B18|nr:hypothetical protein [Halovivax sp. TS33]
MAVDDGRENGGSDGDESGNSDRTDATPSTSSLPPCPRCGTPITMTTATGPDSAVAKPCGCRVPPTALEFE